MSSPFVSQNVDKKNMSKTFETPEHYIFTKSKLHFSLSSSLRLIATSVSIFHCGIAVFSYKIKEIEISFLVYHNTWHVFFLFF